MVKEMARELKYYTQNYLTQKEAVLVEARNKR